MDHDDTGNPPSDEVVPDGNPEPGAPPPPPYNPRRDLIGDMNRPEGWVPKPKRHWFKRRQRAS